MDNWLSNIRINVFGAVYGSPPASFCGRMRLLLIVRSEIDEPCQSPCHEFDHCDLDEGFCGFPVAFKIPCHAPICGDPGEGAFDNPAFGKHLETLGGIVTTNNLDVPWRSHLHPLPGIAAIHVQEWKTRGQAIKQSPCAVAFLNARRMHIASEQQTQRIVENLALAALHFLAGIAARIRPAFHRQTVDDGRTGLRLAGLKYDRASWDEPRFRQKLAVT